MTDDEIRDALVEASGSFAPFSESDHEVIDRERAFGELHEVDRWVIEHGGWIETVSGHESKASALGVGSAVRPHRRRSGT